MGVEMNDKILATVTLLTYNGEEFLEEVLNSVLNQKTNFSFQFQIFDTSSKDRTLEILEEYNKKFPGKLVIYHTNPADFGHGKSRNVAMEKANGEYVCFLTQDATPLSDTWLQSYIDAFKLDDKIALAFGPHLPRRDCNPVIKRDLEQHFASFGTMTKPLVQEYTTENKPADLNTILGFFSDVNSCLKKSTWKKIPYQDVSYAEDQIIAHDMLKAGYKKVYVPAAAVYHSHTYPTFQYLRRYFDEFRGLKESVNYTDPNVTPLNFLPHALKGWLHDSKYIYRSQEYSIFEKIRWVFAAFWMNIFRHLASYLGPRYMKLPTFIYNQLSLEKVNKRKNHAK